MCLTVYIASNKPLPFVNWNSNQPKFHVLAINDEDKGIEKQFKNMNVVYAGSHEGCGCGFFKEGEEGKELEMRQANYEELAYYLSSLRFSGAKLEIYSCWAGDQAKQPEFRERITLASLVSPEFQFKERAYYEIA